MITPRNLRSWIIVTALAALPAAALVLSVRSEAASARFFGYSAARLGLAGLLLLAALLLVIAALALRGERGEKAAARMSGWLAGGTRLRDLLWWLIGGLILLAGAFLFSWLFVPSQLRGPIAWAALAVVLAIVLLLQDGRARLRQTPLRGIFAGLPRPGSLNPAQRRVLAVLAVIGMLYFALFIPENLQRAENPHEFSLHGGDEYIIYPILTQMMTPGQDLNETLYHLVVYEDYHYGYPFYVISALVLLPVRLILGPGFVEHTQLNLLLLRQLVSVLPVILSALLLTYLFTRFRTRRSAVALFVFLLALPALVAYNLRFWHPDSLAVLCVVLTLFFLERDQLRLGGDFLLAALFCGLASAVRLSGFFFVLAVGGYLLFALLRRRAGWRAVIGRGLAFVTVMSLTIVLASPFLFHPAGQASFGQIMGQKTAEMSQGYDEPDPEGVYRTGLIAWMPFVQRHFAHPLVMAALLGGLIAGGLLLREERDRLLCWLTLGWWLAAMGYLFFFVAVKSPHYMLPPMLPFMAAAGVLPRLSDVRKGEWPREMLWRAVGWIAAVALLLGQFVINVRADIALILH